MLPNIWTKNWYSCKKKGQFIRIVIFNIALLIFNRTSRQKSINVEKIWTRAPGDPFAHWGWEGTLLPYSWPQYPVFYPRQSVFRWTYSQFFFWLLTDIITGTGILHFITRCFTALDRYWVLYQINIHISGNLASILQEIKSSRS